MKGFLTFVIPVILLLKFNLIAQEDRISYEVRGTLFHLSDKKARSNVKVCAYKVNRTTKGKIHSYNLDNENLITYSDDKGNFHLNLYADTEYSIECLKEGYSSLPIPFHPKPVSSGEKISIEIELLSHISKLVTVSVLDNISGQAIYNSKIKLLNLEYNFSKTIHLQQSDAVFVCLPGHEYNIQAEAEGYFFYEHSLNDALKTKDNSINFNIELQPIRTGIKRELAEYCFNVNESLLNHKAPEELELVYDLLIANPSIVIEIGVHTDSRGDTDYNLTLSKKRAEEIKSYLVSMGIYERKIITKGYGESQLKNECKDGVKCSTKQHVENRRIDITVVDIRPTIE